MKHTYKRPDDIRSVLPSEYVSRFLALDYDPSVLDAIFNISVQQSKIGRKKGIYLDYYRMNLIADIEESEKLIEEDKDDE